VRGFSSSKVLGNFIMLLLLRLSTAREEIAKRPSLFPLVASLLDNEIEKTVRQIEKILDLGLRCFAFVTTDDDVAHSEVGEDVSNKFYFAVFGNNFDPSAV